MAQKDDCTIAIEFDWQTPREKSIYKLSQVEATVKIILLRGGQYTGNIPGIIVIAVKTDEGESAETNIIDCSTQLKECQQIVESAEKMFLPNLAADITMRLRDGVEFEVIKELLLIAVGKDNPTAYFTKMAQSYYARGIKTYADYCKEKGIEIAKPKAEMSVEERRIAAGFKP